MAEFDIVDLTQELTPTQFASGVHGEWEGDDPSDAPANGDTGDTSPSTEELLQQAQETVIVQRPVKTPDRPWTRKFPVKCPECDEIVLSSSIGTHRKLHGVRIKHTTALLASMRYDGPYTPKPGRRPVVNKLAANKQERDRLKKEANRGINPPTPTTGRVAKTAIPSTLDADAFTNAILATLFPVAMPMKDYPAVQRWVAATKEFLREIEG